uniref:Uncharacterized protein n=1 Tax=Noccaea caerulescens TaxID=107243 RepID=A0A1J3J3Z1_NOCCA
MRALLLIMHIRQRHFRSRGFQIRSEKIEPPSLTDGERKSFGSDLVVEKKKKKKMAREKVGDTSRRDRESAVRIP